MGITEIDPCTFGLALSPLEYILPKCRNTYTKIDICQESTAVLFVMAEHWIQAKH